MISAISCGAHHSVFVADTGHVYSMGSNQYGQLGIGEDANAKNTPSLVESLADQVITMVQCGLNHTLALSDNGQLYAWGYAKFGAIGNGSDTDAFSPV